METTHVSAKIAMQSPPSHPGLLQQCNSREHMIPVCVRLCVCVCACVCTCSSRREGAVPGGAACLPLYQEVAPHKLLAKRSLWPCHYHKIRTSPSPELRRHSALWHSPVSRGYSVLQLERRQKGLPYLCPVPALLSKGEVAPGSSSAKA